MIRKNKISPTDEEAYWISPVGEIFFLNKSHISEKFYHQFIFGLSRSYLELFYDINDKLLIDTPEYSKIYNMNELRDCLLKTYSFFVDIPLGEIILLYK